MSDSDIHGLLSRLKELEELLNFPSVSGHIEQASKLALSLARNAPNGNVANLAMKLSSEITVRRRSGMTRETDISEFGRLVKQLRAALLEATVENRK
jgi:hypothetical protein